MRDLTTLKLLLDRIRNDRVAVELLSKAFEDRAAHYQTVVISNITDGQLHLAVGRLQATQNMAADILAIRKELGLL